MREGARAAIGENDGPPRRREMRMQPIESIHCPYCGEPIDLSPTETVRVVPLPPCGGHRGGQFRHGLVEDVDGNKWSINRYENDILTAGCHRIAYSEMESIAKQLGWV